MPAYLREVLDTEEQFTPSTHYQAIPDTALPYAWFHRSGVDKERDANGNVCNRTDRFAFEIIARDDVEASLDAFELLLEAIEDHELGDWLIQFVEVDDADDDYQFQSIGENQPDFVHAYEVVVYSVPLAPIN